MKIGLVLALLAGSIFLNAGCHCHDNNGDGDVTDNGECVAGKAPLPNDTGTPDPTEPDSYYVDCGDGGCTGNTIQINNTILTDCFSTNGSTFDTDTPLNIKNHCTAGLSSGSCTIPYGVGCDVAPDENQADACVSDCAQTGAAFYLGGNIWQDPSDNCTWDYNQAFSDLDTALATLITDMDNVANFGTGLCVTHFSSQNLHGNIVATPQSTCGSDCNNDASAKAISPDMEYGLAINSTNSYVKLQATGFTTFQKPVHGSVAVSTTPGKAMLWGQAIADNGTFIGTNLNNWHFLFASPIGFTGTGGNFTITPAQESAGIVGAYGQAWGQTIGTKIVTANNITGSVNLTNHTWTMTYSEVDYVFTITVHLEGTVY